MQAGRDAVLHSVVHAPHDTLPFFYEAYKELERYMVLFGSKGKGLKTAENQKSRRIGGDWRSSMKTFTNEIGGRVIIIRLDTGIRFWNP